MKIIKRLTFSDVGAGYLHVANVTTNCPTLISARIAVTTSFNAPSVIAFLKFDPVSGSDVPIGRQVTTADGYAYPMSNGGGQDNIYTEVNGEVLVRLVQDTVAPTQGDAIVMVEIEAIPLS